jgi:hypothetical protein
VAARNGIPIESFEEASALPRAQLEQVLEHGYPDQKLWAIWVLALREGDGAVRLRVEREPDPGVRRTLAVILAGHGNTQLLVALARHDPELLVRATAFHLATRLAAGGALDIEVVLEARMREPAIRIAVLGALERGTPAPLLAFAHHQLACGVADVELEAFEALLRLGGDAEREVARAWLLRQGDVLPGCDRWLRVAGVQSLAELFETADHVVRARVLRSLRAPPWPAAALLVGDSLDLLREAIARRDIAIPTSVLARGVIRGGHRLIVEQFAARLASAVAGRELYADLRAAIELDDARERLADLLGRARRYAEAFDIADGPAVLDELARLHPVEQLIGLDNALGRWLPLESGAAWLALLAEVRRYCSVHVATNRNFRTIVQLIDRLQTA